MGSVDILVRSERWWRGYSGLGKPRPYKFSRFLTIRKGPANRNKVRLSFCRGCQQSHSMAALVNVSRRDYFRLLGIFREVKRG